ncbi:unnamed protein product [Brassica oleracea]
MFGKVIYLSENPSFFFRFSQYIIVQILRVKKKYEMWFWLMETGENVPAHDREIDEECKAKFVSIIENTTFSDQDSSWDDEVEDEAVDNMLCIIGKDMHSRNPCLLGGLMLLICFS